MDIPDELVSAPFTSATARQAGVGRDALRGRRFHRLFRGIYVSGSVELTPSVVLAGARLLAPLDALVSHTSAMELYGISRPRRFQRHEFSTNTTAVSKHTDIQLHRRLGRLTPFERGGIAVTGPDRTFVDCALRLNLVELVALGDWLLHRKETTLESLWEYAMSRHLDGVRRSRRLLQWVREGVESPRETTVRLMLVLARLPEPACNEQIHSDSGEWLARGDLVYCRWKVLVEYDGWHHERDAVQRQRDRERREALEADGWRVIVITSEDLRIPQNVPWRVYKALRQRGYTGPTPSMNDSWRQWFPKM